jgi:hypothetical protein
VYSSEKQKIDVLGGFVEERDEESPYEFSTLFSADGIEYSQYHIIRQQVRNYPYHITLLKGFDGQDIEKVTEFDIRLDMGDVPRSAIEGEIIEIAFTFDSIKDRVGQLSYLN